jgi:hypothetical protein
MEKPMHTFQLTLKEGHPMKKPRLLPLIFILFLLGLSTLISFKANAITMKTAVQTSALDNIQVDQIDHTVKILGAGSVAINDTVQLSAKQNTTLTEYPLGFPYRYKYHLAHVSAFNTSNPAQIFNVSLDTGLGNYIGYYGVTVVFPQEGVQLRVGEPPFRFTVVFVFANLIIDSTYTYTAETTPPKEVTEPILTMDYPMFPSLLQNASMANTTVTTPPNTVWEGPPIGNFSFEASVGASQVISSINRPLPALTYAPGLFNFTQSTGVAYQLVSIDDLERRVEIDGQGSIFITDAYTVTNHMSDIVSSIYLNLPTGASGVAAFDALGNSLTITRVSNTTTYNLNLGISLQPESFTQCSLSYSLLQGKYIDKTGSGEFDLNIPVTSGFNSVVGKLTLDISLPEGASITEYPSMGEYNLQNNAFQQEVVLTAYNVSSLESINLHMSFVYSVFWTSFRPTLWMTAIVAVGIVIALFWRTQKPAVSVSVPSVATKPQSLKALVSSYEERTKALLELESLDRQVQKGRLPRRRYKVRRRMLESQISRLDRELVDLKQRAKSMGSRYAEILKDVEIAEAELEGIEVEERRAMARYRAGAYTLDEYRRRQEQYNKRREKAKATIEGALLRLSEGIA